MSSVHKAIVKHRAPTRGGGGAILRGGTFRGDGTFGEKKE